MMGSYYLELLKNHLNFPPVSRDINVFFDECRRQVFAVASEDGMTGVHVKGQDATLNANFKLQDKGSVISIKFSPDQRILAIQRSSKAIDFVNFYDGGTTEEYQQCCKGKSTQIIGFCWTGPIDIVFVTNQGIEFYQIQSDKYSLKFIKQYPASVNWFVFLPESSVLLLSSGIMGNTIHPYIFKSGTVIRLPRFEVENAPCTRNPQPASLLERDVTVANIYNNIYVVVLRNQPRSFNAIGAEIALYQLQKDSPAKKAVVLQLGAVGRFAVNVVDNLVAVHHQASKTSMIFDINLGGEFNGQVAQYNPVLAPLPIEPFSLTVEVGAEATHNDSVITTQVVTCESYSPNWVVFQPNIIIDAKLGYLWKLNVKLQSLTNMIEDKGRLIDFLLLRSNSKNVILSVCNDILNPNRHSSLAVIAQIFDKINSVYGEFYELNKTGTTQVIDTAKENEITGSWFQKQAVLDQQDMYSQVFLPFVEKEVTPRKFVVGVLLEYIRSLNHHKIPVEYFLNKLIINVLVSNSLFYQLHQFLQYHVLSDSKPLAFLMLSLENLYPPAYDLALDMMKRLGDAHEIIIETLISKGDIISALKYLQNVDLIDSAAPRKFLSAALKSKDDRLFYTAFTFFQQRNIKLRKSSKFMRDEQCEKYENIFENKFGLAIMKKEGVADRLSNIDGL